MPDALAVTGIRMRSVVTGRSPSRDTVALAAGSPWEQPLVKGRVSMAGGACRRESTEASIGMAAVAREAGMGAGQWEDNAVVECRRSPGAGRMASSAVCPKFSSVGIVLYMAGITIRGCIFE